MKKGKGKVLTASQLALGGMVLVLAAAVWLNTKYSSKLTAKTTKYMGETTLVSKETQDTAVAVGADANDDYFSQAIADRDSAYKEAEETAMEILATIEGTDEEKDEAIAKLSALAERKITETQIENLLSAKGFEQSLAIISDSSVTVVVKSNGLLASETVQIQDIVINMSAVNLNNIKIVTVEG